MKLLDQYRRLYTLLQGQPQQPGLPSLAQAMHCSERNMRNLLAKMQQQGRLQWQAGRGRGNHSQLDFLQTPDTLALDHLSHLLARGDLEQAFASLEDGLRQQLAARLPEYLGVPDAACRSLRMPLFRKVESLDPLKVYGRLEAHLVRQIFSRLTTFDHQQNALMPAIAHHWESEKNATVWHFWLRPGLSFHDGMELGVDDVKASFLRLRDESAIYQRLYRHLQHVETGPSRRVSFYLEHSDQLWPHCLATANSSIVPRHRNADFERFPVGSGAFRVIRNNTYQLTLQAFKDYYRERPLLDEIDLWMLPPPSGPSGFDLQFGYANEDCTKKQTVAGAESGCTYIICNPCRNAFKTVEQRLALADWLAPEMLIDPNERSRKAASGLLAIWKHRVAKKTKCSSFKAGCKLRMVSGQTQEMLSLAATIKQRLEAGGVNVIWTSLPFDQLLARDWMKDADLVVTREVMHDDQDFGCYEWFAADSVFRRWMPDAALKHIDLDLMKIKTLPDSKRRMLAYARIGKRLVQEGWLIPISHENQQVSIAPHVAGVRMTPFGFVSFDEMWLRQ
ncbi:SgrR family transcriptional regulator [Undibacterium sp. Ji49W]|uniref:SgrR family transcriptional regulator n=1 Tax=Undibacterium sp. Ji49W TaxID=3413040 RepID=UPI003BF43E57